MLVSELIQGIEGLITEIEAFHYRESPRDQTRQTAQLWYQEKRAQAHGMMRTIGRLKPFIYRFRGESDWLVEMHGHIWNVLDNMADMEMVGGISRTQCIDRLSGVLGILSAYPQDAEVPLEGEIRLTKIAPIQEVMEAYLPYLHPALQKAPRLFLDGHFTEAVRESCLGLFNRIRTLTGRIEDGMELVNPVFGKTPSLVLGDQATETGRNRQEGLAFALRGFVNGVRNPTFHESGEMPGQEAFEWMVTASRLCHLLDECRRVP